MAHAITITRAEFEQFIVPLRFQQVQVPGTVELVYERACSVGAIRVYSTINSNGLSRGVGSDAIRVTLFSQGKIIGADTRVHRVEGWRNNLMDRLRNWKALVGPVCPECGKPTVYRHGTTRGRKWSFWGCSAYPECKGKVNV